MLLDYHVKFENKKTAQILLIPLKLVCFKSNFNKIQQHLDDKNVKFSI